MYLSFVTEAMTSKTSFMDCSQGIWDITTEAKYTLQLLLWTLPGIYYMFKGK